MIKALSRKPRIWLDIHLCENIYNIFRKHQNKYKVGEPLPPFKNRYPGVLESIIESVKLRADLLSYDMIETAAHYYVHLAKSQAFLNGNKRMAVVLTDMFLYLNGLKLQKTWFDLADLTLLVSEDHTNNINYIAKNIVPVFREIISPLE